MTISHTLLQDLGIDPENMMRDPEEFARQCQKAAADLEAILKEDHSVTTIAKRVRGNAKNTELPQTLKEQINSLYTSLDESASPEEILLAIDAVKEFQKDLETLLDAKVTRLSLEQTSEYANKRIAHMRYVQLRKAYNDYSKFIGSLMGMDFNFAEIKALPGNYGDGVSTLDTVAFYLVDDCEFDEETGEVSKYGEEWFSYVWISKKIGKEFPNITAFYEWLKSEDNTQVLYKRVVK